MVASQDSPARQNELMVDKVTMPTSLRVLIVEDSESDAALILRMLKKAGYTVYSETVQTEPEMEAALATRTWDIVIADYRLPQFDAPAALALLGKMGLDIPFVAVSGTIGEETAVALMKAGASDYLMKDNLARLAPVVERELAEAHRRQEYRRAAQETRESEARYRSLFENSPISLWEEDFSAVKLRIDALRAEGVTDFRAYFSSHPEVVREFAGLVKVLDVNQVTLDLYKAGSKAEVLTNLDRIYPEELLEQFKNEFSLIAEGDHHFEYETINATLDGKKLEINLNWAAVSGHETDLARVIISVQDIGQRKRAERQLRETETRLRSLVEHMPAVVYTERADEPGRIVYMSPQIEALTGYAPSVWLDEMAFIKKIVHPDDLEQLHFQYVKSSQSGEPFRLEYRLRTRAGATVWVRDEAVLLRDEDGQALYWQGVMLDITETKQVEAQLQESQRHLAQLMNNLPGMAFRGRFTPGWKMDFVSEGSLALTGYQPWQLTGDPDFRYLDLVHPEDLKNNWALVNISLAQKHPYQLNYRIKTSSGQEKWVWEHAQGIYDSNGELSSVEGFIIDITESKHVEAAIQRHLAELEVLYRNSQAINRLMDPSQIAARVIEILDDELDWHHIAFRLYNPATGEVELLAFNQPGLNQAELEAQKARINQTINSSSKGLSGWVYEHGQPVRCARVREDSRYVESHPEVRSGLYVPLRTGERTIGSISVESHLEDGFSEQDERLLITIANQTAVSIENAQLFSRAQEELAARKQAEAQLLQAQVRLEQRVAERTADLKSANLALQKAARLKDEFLASMSHELRTPLTGILGLSEVLQLQTYGELSEKQLTALKHIASSGRQLLDMINDILDFSRLETRQVELRFGSCQLAQICQSCLQQVAAPAEQKNLQTSFSIDPASIEIQADAQRLKQMIGNLLNNAVKFTPAGGSLGIDVSGSPAEQLVRITVWDTGIGIRTEDLPHLFQTFVQLDASLSRQYNGAGLGLALAKRLAELQGGTIRVESTFGKGSRFTISLPWTN
jgi:PAS domain S-box-containing protein